MRILLISRNFPPLVGGMERLNWHLAAELGARAEVRLVSIRGAAAEAPQGIVVREAALRPLPWFFLGAGIGAVREALRFRPDWVIAGSGLTAPIAALAARLAGANYAVYVHGLDLVVGSRLYQAGWLPAIRRADSVFANSAATLRLAIAAGIAEARAVVVHPGVTLAHPDPEERLQIRDRIRGELDVGAGPVLLSVGRLTERKGMVPFVRDVLPLLARRCPDLCLLIVGDTPSAALAAPLETAGDILDVAVRAGVDQHIRLLGQVEENRLRQLWFASDVHVFPVREMPNNPEGFGMVAVEAAASGVPTVAYAVGGVVDAVQDGVSGRLVPPGDSAGFAEAVLQMVQSPPSAQAVRDFSMPFAWPAFGERVFEQLQSGGSDG